MELMLETPADIANSVAADFKKLRKTRKMTVKELSIKSGVSYSSIKRFEYTGEISFVSLIKIASVLNAEQTIKKIFSEIPPMSIQEVIRGNY